MRRRYRYCPPVTRDQHGHGPLTGFVTQHRQAEINKLRSQGGEIISEDGKTARIRIAGAIAEVDEFATVTWVEENFPTDKQQTLAAKAQVSREAGSLTEQSGSGV